jgi:hypothetical protein
LDLFLLAETIDRKLDLIYRLARRSAIPARTASPH